MRLGIIASTFFNCDGRVVADLGGSTFLSRLTWTVVMKSFFCGLFTVAAPSPSGKSRYTLLTTYYYLLILKIKHDTVLP